jgi:hypothetical protein
MTITRQLTDVQGTYLSHVTFVMDYLQLGFNGPILSVFSLPDIETAEGKVRFPAIGSRDSLCSFIGQIVKNVDIQRDVCIVIAFENGRIEIPLDAPHRVLGDAAEYWPKGGGPPTDY